MLTFEERQQRLKDHLANLTHRVYETLRQDHFETAIGRMIFLGISFATMRNDEYYQLFVSEDDYSMAMNFQKMVNQLVIGLSSFGRVIGEQKAREMVQAFLNEASQDSKA